MSQERLAEVQNTLVALERRIRPLEWDAGRNQINEFKKQELERLRQEHTTLTQELTQLQTLDTAEKTSDELAQ